MKKERNYYIYLIILCLIFFCMMFFSYEDPYENLILVITLLLSIKLKNNIKNQKVLSISKIIFIIIIAYSLSLLFLSMKAYDIDKNIDISSVSNRTKAVLLVYEGEAARYELKKEMRNLILRKDLTDIIISPFKLYKKRRLYDILGKSDYKKKTEYIYNQINDSIKDEYKVYLGYLYDEKYIEEEILKIVKDGYEDIIVVPVFLSNINNLNDLHNRVSSLKLYNNNIKIKYTEPLWSSESILQSYLNLIKNNTNANNKNNIGLNLIGIGEKNFNKSENINSVKQNIIFRTKMKNKLISNLNFEDSKIKLSWYNYLEPNYISESNELLEYGISELICIVVDPQLKEIINIDVYNELNDEINFPDGVKCKILNGFISDKNIVNELINRIKYIDMQNWN